MVVRNDEFVHWKGHQSNLVVRYSFKPLPDRQIELARNINIQFNQTFGPGESSKPILDLYDQTSKHIEERREAVISRIRTRLEDQSVFMKSRFLNDSGESVIKGYAR